MSNRSKQCSNRGTSSHRAHKPVRPLAATAAIIGGAGIVLGAPVAALFIGSGVAQAAPLVSAPSDLCTSLVGCNDPSASSVSSSGSSLFGASTAVRVTHAGPGVAGQFG